MAVQEAIHKVLTEDGHDAECRIKWPNDIVLNKKEGMWNINRDEC